MGYDHTLFLTTLAVEPTFVAFLQHSQTHFHGLSCQFFQISLKNSELKTTHNAFQDCRVHFLRQPLSKQLYTLGSLHVSYTLVRLFLTYTCITLQSHCIHSIVFNIVFAVYIPPLILRAIEQKKKTIVCYDSILNKFTVL